MSRLYIKTRYLPVLVAKESQKQKTDSEDALRITAWDEMRKTLSQVSRAAHTQLLILLHAPSYSSSTDGGGDERSDGASLQEPNESTKKRQ